MFKRCDSRNRFSGGGDFQLQRSLILRVERKGGDTRFVLESFLLLMNTKFFGPVSASVLALVIGAGGGFMLGKSASSEVLTKKEASADARSSRRTSSGRYSLSESGQKERSRTRPKSLDQALAVPGQSSRFQALMDYYAGLSPSEFESEAAKLEDLPWSDRFMVGNLLFARWGEEDPTAAMAYTQTMGFTGMFVRGTVMRSWAAKFPEDAAEYYTSNPAEFRMSGMFGGRSRGGNSTAGTIAKEWARQDSASALAWAQSLEGKDQGDAVKSVLAESAKADPEKAAEMLSTLNDPDSKKKAQNAVAREWGKKSWTEAKAWIATLPVDEQSAALSQALRGLSETDPTVAAENIQLVEAGEKQDKTVEWVARRWGRDDPESAAAWLLKEGSENAQKESIGKVMSSWVRQDSASALNFINEQPEGGVRDQAVSSYVSANASGKVQENLALAETIGDRRTRSRTIGVTVAGWMREDPEAAKDYLKSSQALSKDEKKRMNRWFR